MTSATAFRLHPTRRRAETAIPAGHGRAVATVATTFAVVYALIGVLRHRALETTAFDLGIFTDAVHDWAHFAAPHVAVKGVYAGYGPGFNLLGDHFHPILALLAPTYWIWPHPETLIVDQAALLALSVVPVWVFARRKLGGESAPYLVAFAYGLYWGIQEAVTFDFHEIAFAVPLIAFAIERMDARRYATAALAIAALVLVKEDLAPLVTFFGLAMVVRGQRRLGGALAAFGLVAFVVITKVIMPALAGHDYVYWSYGALGPDLPSALWHMVAHPLDTVHQFFTPAVKDRTLGWIFLPFLFASFGSPIVLLAIPLLAERFFSDQPNYWAADFHYTATLAPIVALAAIDGVARLGPWLGRAGQRRLEHTWPAAVALLALALIPRFSFAEFGQARLWVGDAHIRAGRAAIAAVPSHVTVVASDEIQPHLTGRTNALLLDARSEYGAGYVVANVGKRVWPVQSIEGQRAYVDRLRQHGWTVVFARDWYVVLRAPGR